MASFPIPCIFSFRSKSQKVVIEKHSADSGVVPLSPIINRLERSEIA